MSDFQPNNQSTGGIRVCFDLSIPCTNIKVEWISQEGLLVPCKDGNGNNTNCIDIFPNPYGNGNKCIEGWVFCDECKFGNNKPIYFKKCFCDTDADCTLYCEFCKTYGDVKVCEQSLTPQQIKEGKLCNGDCPPSNPIYDPILQKCVECVTGSPHPLDKCVICRDGVWVIKCKPCDPATGKCVDCVDDFDCKDNTDGRTKCGPDGCECLSRFRYDFILRKCVEEDECKTDIECGPCRTCNTIIKSNGESIRVCEEIKCPVGFKLWRFPDGTCKCVKWTCTNTTCENGGDCGKDCGCILLDGIKQCVPCALLNCTGSTLPCGDALGCDCNQLLQCGKSDEDICKEEYCDDFNPCAKPGCTCYRNKCISCSNFPCANGDCDSRKNCKCTGDECEGDGNDDNDDNGCQDSFKLNKVCEGLNCELNAVLSIKDCKCSDIETAINFKGYNQSTNKLTFGGDLFKGANSPNTNFKDYRTNPLFGDKELINGIITYDIIVDGVKVGESKQLNIVDNKVPDTEIDISQYLIADPACGGNCSTLIPCKSSNCICQNGVCVTKPKKVGVKFNSLGYQIPNNNCIQYNPASIGDFSFNLSNKLPVIESSSKKSVNDFGKDTKSTKKPLIIWTKDNVVFKKEYPKVIDGVYKDSIKTTAEGLELLNTYVVKTDCSGCAPNVASVPFVTFCCIEKDPVITNCGTALTAEKLTLCEVNTTQAKVILEIDNGTLPVKKFDWTADKVDYNDPTKPLVSVKSYFEIKSGKNAGKRLCEKTYDIPDDKPLINLDVVCKDGRITGTIKELNKQKIKSVTFNKDSNTTGILLGSVNSDIVTFTVNNLTKYLDAINSATGIVATIITEQGCKLELPLTKGDCKLELDVTFTNVNNTCDVSSLDTGSAIAQIIGGGDQKFDWVLERADGNEDKILNTASPVNFTKLNSGGYTVRVSGNGFSSAKQFVITDINTIIKYKVDLTPGCGTVANSTKITLVEPKTAPANLAITIGNITQSILPGGESTTFIGLPVGTFTPTFNIFGKYIVCNITNIVISNTNTTIKIGTKTKLCLNEEVPLIFRNPDIADDTQNILNNPFVITAHDAVYDPVTKKVIKTSNSGTSYVEACLTDPCSTLSVHNGNGVNGFQSGLSIVPNSNNKCIKYILPVHQDFIFTFTPTCNENTKKIDAVVAVTPLGNYSVTLLQPDGNVFNGGSLILDGNVYKGSGEFTPTVIVRVVDNTTGCKKEKHVNDILPCGRTVTCPQPISISDQTICDLNMYVEFVIQGSKLVAAGYAPNEDILIRVLDPTLTIPLTIRNYTVNANTYAQLTWSRNIGTPTRQIRVAINSLNDSKGCGVIDSYFTLNINHARIIAEDEECALNSSCTTCVYNINPGDTHDCKSDGLGTFRCIRITLCPPDFNGEEGSPCNGTCPCNDGLDCSDNIHICVNPDAPIECGCGEPNPAYPGDPNAVPCLCNLGNDNCPGFGGSCGGSPLGSAGRTYCVCGSDLYFP